MVLHKFRNVSNVIDNPATITGVTHIDLRIRRLQ